MLQNLGVHPVRADDSVRPGGDAKVDVPAESEMVLNFGEMNQTLRDLGQ